MHLAALSGGILAQFCFSITVGEDRFSWLLVGDEGSLRIPDSGTVVVRQRHDDDEPVELQIASAEKVLLPIDLMQHTWIPSSRTLSRRYATTTRISRATRASPPSPTASAPKKSSMPPAGRAALDAGRRRADEGA
jgi:hypothetical protein